jgi:protein gp37
VSKGAGEVVNEAELCEFEAETGETAVVRDADEPGGGDWMNKTKIEWCDYTWNPITGCSPVSEACENCYAAAISKRFKLPWGKPVFHPDRLGEPCWVKKPERIFVCSMSDLFHEGVQAEWIDKIFEIMWACPQHTFILLTKRPHLINEKLYCGTEDCPVRELGQGDNLLNVWMGVTVENQARAEERIPELLRIPAVKRFVSVEPMLEDVDLVLWMSPKLMRRLDWVICGPETGPKARLCDPEWIRRLYSHCRSFDIPFFDKSEVTGVREFPAAKT